MAMTLRDRWLNARLVQLAHGEWWTGRDFFEGVMVFGALGAGKTSGSGRAIAIALLNAGYGGLVCTAKGDELKTWVEYFRASNRPLTDLVVIQPFPMHPHMSWPSELGTPPVLRYNALQEEYRASGGMTANAVDLLNTAVFDTELASKEDPFWPRSCRECTTHGMELAMFGGGDSGVIRLDDLLNIMSSAPTSRADLNTSAFLEGRCGELIRRADEMRQQLPEPRYRDLQITAQYWMRQFASLAPETRSSIVATFTAKVAPMLRSPLRELLTSGSDAAASPDVTLNVDPKTGRSKVVLLNLPVKLYGEAGRVAQVMYKAAWQRAADRRAAGLSGSNSRACPAFLFADEAQFFLTSEDALFQQTARSACVATVYLTQNLPNLYAELGEMRAQSLLGNLQTKIFHANGDPMTNEWAERVFAKPTLRIRTEPLGGREYASEAHQPHPMVPAIAFTELRKGGTEARKVGAYVFQAGRQWSEKGADRHYFEFNQE